MENEDSFSESGSQMEMELDDEEVNSCWPSVATHLFFLSSYVRQAFLSPVRRWL